MSDSLRPCEPQHARPPCPWPTPRVYPNSCPLSWWCHPTISSFVVPFFSCPQSFPALRSFQMGQFFTSGGQSTGVSASTSDLSMNTQDWSPLGWTAWISLQSKGLSPQFKSISSHRMCKYRVYPMSKGVKEVNIPKCVFRFFSLAKSAESKRFGTERTWHSPQWSVSQDTRQTKKGRGGSERKREHK